MVMIMVMYSKCMRQQAQWNLNCWDKVMAMEEYIDTKEERKKRFAKNGVILFVIANRNSYCFCNSIESIKLNAFKQHIKMVIVIFFNWKHYGAYNSMHSEIFNPNDRFVRWFWARKSALLRNFQESAFS